MNISYTHAATVYSSRPYAYYSFAIICLFLLTIPTFAQKVKKEVILYKNANAVAVGYTCKGQFVDSSKITIYRLLGSANYRKIERDGKVYFKNKYGERSLALLDIVADGIYYKMNGKAYLEGEYHPEPYVVTYKGTFSFCNSVDGISVIADAKKARQFKFELTDVFYCHVKNTNSWEMYIAKVKDKYSIRTSFFNKDNIESLKGSVPLRAVTLDALHYNQIFNLLTLVSTKKS